MTQKRVWFFAKATALLILGLVLVTGCASTDSGRSASSRSCPNCSR